MSFWTVGIDPSTLAALGDMLNDAQRQHIASSMQEAINRQLEETLFGGRKMPNQTAITESVIVAPRKARKHPFGIINFEYIG